MASLITSCCGDYSPDSYSLSHQASPIFDIVGGIVLLIIGHLIASGTLTASVGAMCGAFAVGGLFLGSGLSTLGQWHCRDSVFKCCR